VDAPGKDDNASMPEQVKRPNPWRKMINPWRKMINPWRKVINPWRKMINPWRKMMIFKFGFRFGVVWVALSLVGGLFLSLLCIRQTD